MTKQQAQAAAAAAQATNIRRHRHRHRPRRVCLFGLSGDPPTGTGGHVGIVQRLAQLTNNNNNNSDNNDSSTNSNNSDNNNNDNNNSIDDDTLFFDEIRILPVYRHTFMNKRNRLASYEDRMNMCRVAFAGIPNTIVSNAEYLSWCHAVKDLPDEESKSKALVGTANLLDYLLETEPKSPSTTVEFTFCLGADAFMDLMAGKWKQSATVRQLLDNRFLVLDRAKAVYRHDDGSSNETKGERKCSSNDEFHQQVAQVANARLLVMTTTTPPPNNNTNNESSPLFSAAVSSSQLRAFAAAGNIANINDERLLLPAVKEYILQHGLYGCCCKEEEPSA